MEYQDDAVLVQVLIRKDLVDIDDLSLCHELQRQDAEAGREPRKLRDLLVEIDAITPEEVEAAFLERSSDSSRLRRRESSTTRSPRRRPTTRRHRVERERFERDFIGPFQVIKKIASGGMGSIYTARDRLSGRLVALKVLAANRGHEDDTERFLREARIACSLDHDGLVRGYSFGNDAGMPFFAMELVEGESLKARLKRGALKETAAMDIALRVARALDHVHKAELIHRDIKPDNILLGDDGSVKLCDLGLAREVNLMTTVTQSGQTLGTPRYISPEQARAEKDIDARADIYSLGITFFHMLTGRPPFTEESGIVVISRHLYDEVPSIRSVDPSLDRGLADIVRRMTIKDRNDRMASAAELVEALEALIKRRFRGARPRARLGRCA